REPLEEGQGRGDGGGGREAIAMTTPEINTVIALLAGARRELIFAGLRSRDRSVSRTCQTINSAIGQLQSKVQPPPLLAVSDGGLAGRRIQRASPLRRPPCEGSFAMSFRMGSR